nr:UPF0481 protein At3g47200-like isoform X2 [Quercus suber]
MNEIFLEAEPLQEMIELQTRSQEINEHGADWIINGCNIPTELKSFLDDQGRPIGEQEKWIGRVTCPKVPPMLRKRSQEYFDPKIFSFGPYHHGKPELQEGETLKTKLMLEFIKESGKSVPDFYNKVLDMNYDNRACYVDGSTDDYDDNQFAWMMLRDGCSILYIIDILANNRIEKQSMLVKNHVDILPQITTEMILLENQIPFAVLKLLMSLKNLRLGSIKRFIYLYFCGILEMAVTGDENEGQASAHLLDRIHEELSKVNYQYEMSCHCFNFCETLSRHITQRYYVSMADFLPSFGSVGELKTTGIRFKPINSSFLRSAEIGKSISLRGTEFRSGFLYAELKLPPLFLDRAKIKVYSNLAAFEWCPPIMVRKLVITSYIGFLNTLIDGPDDVRELRSKRILLCKIVSDEEVVKMLREISIYGVQTVVFYDGVRKAIEKHYNSKIRTWVAELIYKYFSSPWTALGLFAALAVLVLTVVQTFFAIHPVKEK